MDGGAVAHPKNVMVPLGLPSRVHRFLWRTEERTQRVFVGGPMMGIDVFDLDYPVIKNNNAIIAFDESQVSREGNQLYSMRKVRQRHALSD